jgi:AcrR family transcriptional regulator
MAGNIRDRFRAHIRDEVKQVALRQLAEGGPQAVSVNAIAKELGVSGPALYRYFANRDELLNELIAEAYHDFAAALATATRPTRRLGPPQRLRALAKAYRAWANAQPHRYRLLFSAPLPGYDAQSDLLVTASQEAMNVLLDVLTELEPEREPEPKPVPEPKPEPKPKPKPEREPKPEPEPEREPEPEPEPEPERGPAKGGPNTLDDQLDRWARDRQLTNVSPDLALSAVVTWTHLHGLVSLEIEGNYASMGLDPELLFEAVVTTILQPPGATTRRIRG